MNINRLKASELGVSVQDISQPCSWPSAASGWIFHQEGKQYSVIGQVTTIAVRRPDDLEKMYVPQEGQLPLTSLLDISRKMLTPPTLFHFSRYRSQPFLPGWRKQNHWRRHPRGNTGHCRQRARRLPHPLRAFPRLCGKFRQCLLCVLPGPDPHLPGIGRTV